MAKRTRRDRTRAATGERGGAGRTAGPAQSPRTRKTTPSRRSWPPALLATGAVLLLLLAGAGIYASGLLTRDQAPARSGPPGVGEKPASRVDGTGRLLLPIDAGLSMVSLPDRGVKEVVPAGRTGAVTSARWAPNGSSAAYAFYHVRAGDSSASSEIYLSDLVGEPRILVERDRPGAVVEAPVWAPDGASLYFGYSALENQRVVRRIERLDVATNARTPIVPEAALPDVSPDGNRLVYVRSDRQGDALMIARTDGQDARALIEPGRFSALGAARFSPDGRMLAVPISIGAGQAREPTPAWPLALLSPAVAFAHGDPWEIYLLNLETSELRPLTRLIEDELATAWSPDGATVAVYGSRGLYLVDREGRATFALDRGGYGGIDWAR